MWLASRRGQLFAVAALFLPLAVSLIGLLLTSASRSTFQCPVCGRPRVPRRCSLSALDDLDTAVPTRGPVSVNSTGPKPQIELFIGITTAYSHEALRTAVRKTWLHYQSAWEGRIAHRFFLGETNRSDLMEAAERENSKYQDIVWLPFVDTYLNLSLKTMWMSHWALEHFDFAYLLKIDDDTFLRLDRFVAKLQDKPREKFFYGWAEPYYEPERGGPQPVTEEVFPSSRGRGPPWQHGFIYTLSRDCASWVAERLPTPLIFLEDINTALILADHNVSVPMMTGIKMRGCAEDMLASHYSGVDAMLNWYVNSLCGPTMCCESVWPDR